MAITLDGSNTGTVGLVNAATSKAATSGTSLDFTAIPAGVKRVTVIFNGVSLSGTAQPRVRLGTGGTPATSGYSGSTAALITGTAASSLSAGFDVQSSLTSSSNTYTGSLVFTLLTGNTWVCSGTLGVLVGTTALAVITGSVALAGALDIVRITSTNGTDTFDAGSVNILYE